MHTDVIKGPLITEKLDKAREKLRQYSFLVDRRGHQARHPPRRRDALQGHRRGVRTIIVRGKVKRVGK